MKPVANATGIYYAPFAMANPTAKRRRRTKKEVPLYDGPILTAMCVRVSPIVYDQLRKLVDTGLFGLRAEEAAERLICEKLRSMRLEPNQNW